MVVLYPRQYHDVAPDKVFGEARRGIDKHKKYPAAISLHSCGNMAVIEDGSTAIVHYSSDAASSQTTPAPRRQHCAHLISVEPSAICFAQQSCHLSCL